MDSQTMIALAGIASGAIITQVITALLTRRLLGEQQLVERESADLVEARRIIMDFAASTFEFQDVSRQYGRELNKRQEGMAQSRRSLDWRVRNLMIGPTA